MIYVDVDCETNGCCYSFEFETEEAEEGSRHEAVCPVCNEIIKFKINFIAVACAL